MRTTTSGAEIGFEVSTTHPTWLAGKAPGQIPVRHGSVPARFLLPVIRFLGHHVLTTGTLLCYGADEGAGALGIEKWDDVEVDLSHPALRGVDDVFEGLIGGCSSDVFV